MLEKQEFLPLEFSANYSKSEMLERANAFYDQIRKRRTVRDFSDRPVPREIIDKCILSAGTAPNGANLQPWHFSVVCSQQVKAAIREAAEEEEREFYHDRAPEEWLNALTPFGTNEYKPFLEIAPYLIVIFAKPYDVDESGNRTKNYYANESVGIATGMLITALHHCGLATLTHTPSPMKFLNQILGRPANERAFLVLVAGYPADGALVPSITKKSLEEITSSH